MGKGPEVPHLDRHFQRLLTSAFWGTVCLGADGIAQILPETLGAEFLAALRCHQSMQDWLLTELLPFIQLVFRSAL
jgi:hypothetical protein